MSLSKAAVDLLQNRYTNKGETAEGVLKRVARFLSIRDSKFEKELLEAMTEGIFFPNSPAIRNAGAKKAMLSACFVLPVEDSIMSIYDTVRNMAVVFQRGGGVGINFSALRPKDYALTGGGRSSGSVSFMNIFDATTEVVKQGGFRRGAGLFALNFNHPDIEDFCQAKLKGRLQNANLSVAVADKDMQAATKRKQIWLMHEGKKSDQANASNILDLMAYGAWVCGDPGILFLDRINKDNRLYPNTVIECTNPCGEVPLPNWGACCLGSINLTKFVEGDTFNYERFSESLKLAARVLLNINTINYYPLPAIQKTMHELNPIGVGIMGFADTLIMLGVKYDSADAISFIDVLGKVYMQATNDAAPDSFYRRSIAPTGSLSILASCSSGIEPVFASDFERHLTVGVIRETKDIYKSEYCRTAHTIDPLWHLSIQAAWQKYVDAGVSKTINCSSRTTVDDIRSLFLQAWKMGVKGVTIFRDQSVEGVWKSRETAKAKCSDEECML